MPEPPSTSLLLSLLLERPWASAGVAALVGAVVLWRGMQEGRSRVQAVGLGLLAAALLNVLVAWLVTTSGEHAARTVRNLVAAAEMADVAAGMAVVADDAVLNFESPTAPGYPVTAIEAALASLASAHRIERNQITHLRGYSVDADTGEVHLACWTQTISSFGQTPSQWVIRVRRQPDGAWKADRITCVSIAGRAPEGVGLWSVP